jgi:hypothetical protein
MIHRIRHIFLFLALFWVGVSGALAADESEPMILTSTAHGREIDEVVAALNRAVVGHNFGFLRQQAMDAKLVPYAQEVRSVRLYYFCNYARMSHALKLDPRATQMLPYRVTLVETPTGVDLIAVNPAWLTQGMGNPALHGESERLKQDYLAILDEAAL